MSMASLAAASSLPFISERAMKASWLRESSLEAREPPGNLRPEVEDDDDDDWDGKKSLAWAR
jgi:hypothetical protein